MTYDSGEHSVGAHDNRMYFRSLCPPVFILPTYPICECSQSCVFVKVESVEAVCSSIIPYGHLQDSPRGLILYTQ